MLRQHRCFLNKGSRDGVEVPHHLYDMTDQASFYREVREFARSASVVGRWKRNNKRVAFLPNLSDLFPALLLSPFELALPALTPILGWEGLCVGKTLFRGDTSEGFY